ncbi:hypothetical protein I4U23_019900 [Adineta vaga]|nr:hypothetical protein I4U23_019900 [Adineta vaga]
MARVDNNTSMQRNRALLIANSDYFRGENRLNKAANNVQDLQQILEEIGFITRAYYNIDQNIMSTIKRFEKEIGKDDMVLFYYSGHCRYVDGKNYLIPANDSEMDTDKDISDCSAKFCNIIERLSEKNVNNVSLFILDSYKPYSLENESEIESISKRARKMKALPRTYIQFACAPNQKHSVIPSRDRNDLFTKHLMNNIRRENIQIVDLFQRVARDVYRESNEKQKPFSTNGLHGYGHIVLNQVNYNERINAYNDRIRDLQVELGKFTLKTSINTNSANDSVHANRIRALIHELTVKRDRTIKRCYSSAPLT